MNKVIGIPSNGPELSDTISDHFGHCNYFVGIEIDEDKNLKKLFSLQNNGHTGCMEPVMNMKERSVTDMIVGGIGGRPYAGFTQYGIGLFKGVKGTLSENIQLFLQGKLQALNEPICAGSDHSDHNCQ
ncbi:MAG: dinitrogenase iron-molybdenum cofactor biosynthesis protein [Candidatus Lokiarchaeota archaeon]|nr:dinitrogenase iron-molybdenum cofactor biosynthesis protein [Candidatus Lokiarchaeota archaeon]